MIQAVEFLLLKLQYDQLWLERFKWFANINMYISAILVSFSVALSSNPYTFFGFLIAHMCWLIAAVVIKDKPLMALNGFFIPLDIYAISIRIM